MVSLLALPFCVYVEELFLYHSVTHLVNHCMVLFPGSPQDHHARHFPREGGKRIGKCHCHMFA